MTNKLIKSNVRVKHDGEVFTPKRIVHKMLNFKGIHSKLKNLHATFMETSAGEGAFLLAILKAKLESAFKQSKDSYEYNRNSLIALSSIYGLELLEDNVSMLVMNMESLFRDIYSADIKKLKGSVSKKVLKSAKTIINCNVVQGNALTGKNGNDKLIVLSEWRPVSKFKVKRVNFYYKSAVNPHQNHQQINLFGNNETQDDTFNHYVPVDITEVYKQLIISSTDNNK